MLGVVYVNFDHFMRDLLAGDPVVWTIVAGVVLASGYSLYRKYCAFSTSHQADAESFGDS